MKSSFSQFKSQAPSLKSIIFCQVKLQVILTVTGVHISDTEGLKDRGENKHGPQYKFEIFMLSYFTYFFHDIIFFYSATLICVWVCICFTQWYVMVSLLWQMELL